MSIVCQAEQVGRMVSDAGSEALQLPIVVIELPVSVVKFVENSVDIRGTDTKVWRPPVVELLGQSLAIVFYFHEWHIAVSW